MKTSVMLWLALAALFVCGLAISQTVHNQAALRRDLEQCAKRSGWLTDNECKHMCIGRTK